MKKRNMLKDKGRREFFRKTAFMSAAALFATARGRRSPAAAAPSASDVRTRSRYRLTEHIRRYYDRASL